MSAGAKLQEEDLRRNSGLLRAVTRALEILGSAHDPTVALTESFEHAARALEAEKALLLRVAQQEPLVLESLRSHGLSPEDISACILGWSVNGVSPSRIRQAIATQEPQLIENSRLEPNSGETPSLVTRPHSVLCAPVIDPWTKALLAVLYFQTTAHPQGAGYSVTDLPFLAGYAAALGHVLGLFLGSEQRYRSMEKNWERRLEREGGVQGPEIIGASEEIRRIRADLHESYLPATETENPKPILILGPTGSGKDLLSRYLHSYSPKRSRHPLVEYNCAGLSGDLAAPTLFGHVRGAFTGATASAPGLLRAAQRGTLFLDEIGDLPPRGQELLLKVFDNWKVQPVGDTNSYAVDVQVICATNRDLAKDVAEGRFRHDLYQRLKALLLRLPPLASRPADIRPLLSHYLSQAERSLKKRTRGLTPDALRLLLAYSWPGNVRELAGVCTALITHAKHGDEITAALIEARCPDVLDEPRANTPFAAEVVQGSFHEARGRFERTFLLDRLELLSWNVQEAARSLSLSVPTLYRYLQRHALVKGANKS
jgi:transcriptional regulator with GAF, ATPase, and Fis domain